MSPSGPDAGSPDLPVLDLPGHDGEQGVRVRQLAGHLVPRQPLWAARPQLREEVGVLVLELPLGDRDGSVLATGLQDPRAVEPVAAALGLLGEPDQEGTDRVDRFELR